MQKLGLYVQRISMAAAFLVFAIIANAQGKADDMYYQDIGEENFSKDTSEVVVAVEDVNGSHFLLLVEGGFTSFKDPTLGLTLCYMQQWGGYVSFHTNFKFQKPSDRMPIDKLGRYEGEDGELHKAFLSGDKLKTRMSIVGGVTYIVIPQLIVGLGGGYSFRRLLFESSDNEWLKVKDNTVEGFTLDINVIGNFNNFLVKLGYTTTKFRMSDIRLGLGYRF